MRCLHTHAVCSCASSAKQAASPTYLGSPLAWPHPPPPGVEICGALKNVLAIAAGIVEGLDLGHNALAALIAQGCAEIRWLAEKLGAKPQTMSGLSGLGDIMLTCYGDLSRNRSVGMRLGRGETLDQILATSTQVRAPQAAPQLRRPLSLAPTASSLHTAGSSQTAGLRWDLRSQTNCTHTQLANSCPPCVREPTCAGR